MTGNEKERAADVGSEPETARDRGSVRDRRHKRASPPAGPHADPSLIDDERTPGAGTLPDPDEKGSGSITG